MQIEPNAQTVLVRINPVDQTEKALGFGIAVVFGKLCDPRLRACRMSEIEASLPSARLA
ncbi:hypothetical protein [Roseovarius rhodophyticola]|uniref:Uncharacterized protein n=1 Tax=Roseovarius rhodophyticola TaxID=3080827 RepID=A0ABZ2TGL1_9RHOB|nr:hypothetical protein [Roseovarius sp. W115]MDV2929137.1 hypothetical protein [Roseovarius sp. W115]